jgi:hypothetical protein
MLDQHQKDFEAISRVTEPPRTGFPRLSTEIRFQIWALCYDLEEPRVVEIQTIPHDNCSDHEDSWCPRQSPSPRPVVVNVCREARNEVRNIAQKAGHLIFTTDLHPMDIFFNPIKDTLYVQNEKEYWIRDWGPPGILTQFKKEHRPENLRFLAVGLEPIDRATTRSSLKNEVRDFKTLEQMMFVVKELEKSAFGRIRVLDKAMMILRRTEIIDLRFGGIVSPWKHLETCHLAMRRGMNLRFVSKTSTE